MLPLEGAQRTWKARHTANVEAKLADARRTLGIARAYYDELEEIGGRLIGERMGGSEPERFLARLVPLPSHGRIAATAGAPSATSSGCAAIRTAYRTAPDLADIRGTRWGALQAVGPTSTTSSRPGRRPDGRTPRPASSARRSQQPLKSTGTELLTEGGTARERDADHGAPRQDQGEEGLQPAKRLRGRADGRADRVDQAARGHHPLTLAPDGDGRFTIIAGERRYRAARQAKLRRCPPRCARQTGRRWRSPSPRT